MNKALTRSPLHTLHIEGCKVLKNRFSSMNEKTNSADMTAFSRCGPALVRKTKPNQIRHLASPEVGDRPSWKFAKPISFETAWEFWQRGRRRGEVPVRRGAGHGGDGKDRSVVEVPGTGAQPGRGPPLLSR